MIVTQPLLVHWNTFVRKTDQIIMGIPENIKAGYSVEKSFSEARTQIQSHINNMKELTEDSAEGIGLTHITDTFVREVTTRLQLAARKYNYSLGENIFS